MVSVGLPGAQQLVVAEKDLNGGHNEGNYAGTVLGTRGIRPAYIPGVLIEMIADVFRRELQSFSGNIYEDSERSPAASERKYNLDTNRDTAVPADPAENICGHCSNRHADRLWPGQTVAQPLV
jgi:hypothetical protein